MTATGAPARSAPSQRRRGRRTAALGLVSIGGVLTSVLGLAAPAWAAVGAAPPGVTRVVSLSGTIDSTCGSGIPAGTPTYPTVQAAITAAGLTASTTEKVYVCAGTYNESVTSNKQGIDIVGTNWNDPSGSSEASIIKAPSGLPAISLGTAAATGVSVQGLTLDGGTYGVVSLASTGTALSITNNVLTNQTIAAVETRGIDSGAISSNTITPAANGNGIVTKDASGALNIQSNEITLSGSGAGVSLVATTLTNISTGTGQLVGGATPSLGNTITGGTTGVLVSGPPNQVGLQGYRTGDTVQNNTISGPSGNGVQLNGGLFSQSIFDNTISGTGASGVLVAGPTTTLGNDLDTTYLYRNTITDAGRDGIEFTGYVTTAWASNGAANGNTITNPARDGINVTGFQTNAAADPSARLFSAWGIRAFSNEITGAGDDGIDITGGRATYPWYNQIKGSGDNGIESDFSLWTDVEYNSISGSGTDGIHIDDTFDSYVWQNSVRNNGDDGIELGDGTQTFSVYYNAVNGNGNGGIRFTGAEGPGGWTSWIAYNNVAGNTGLDCEDQMPGTQTENGTYAGTTGNVWWSNLNYGATDDQPVGICMGTTLKTSGTFRDGEVGNPYVGSTPTVTNGTGPFTWSLPVNSDGTAGTLPVGLSLNPTTGQITGTPTGPITEYPITLIVTGAGGVTGQVSGMITIYPTLTGSDEAVTAPANTPIPPFTPTVVGGNEDTTKTFSVAPGSVSALPPGLSLDPVTGAVAGTPTTPGTYAVTFKVTDNSPNMEDTATLPGGSIELPANADTYVVTFTITPGPVVADGSFGQGTETQPYTSPTPTATGGDGGPYTWGTTSPLPSGLTLDPATGVISGTPATGTQGTWPITLKATDGAGASDTFAADLVILPFDPSAPMADPVIAGGTFGLLGLAAVGLSAHRRRQRAADGTA